MRTNLIECTRSEIRIYVWCVQISQLLEKFNKIGPARPEFTPSEMTAMDLWTFSLDPTSTREVGNEQQTCVHKPACTGLRKIHIAAHECLLGFVW